MVRGGAALARSFCSLLMYAFFLVQPFADSHLPKHLFLLECL